MAPRSSSKRSQHWHYVANVMQFFYVFGFITLRLALVSSTRSPNLAIDGIINGNYEKAVHSLINDAMEKRSSWQQLQGSWGKRTSTSPIDIDSGWTVEPTEDDAILAERWVPILAANGGTLSQQHPEVLKYSMIYLTNAAALKQLTNHRRHDTDDVRALNANDENDDDTYGKGNSVADDGYKFNDDLFASANRSENDENLLNEKRNWKSMNAAWGKRRNEPTWNKFRGAWGKREPSWNNLKGMWGKRSSKDWKKLQSAWGKRAADLTGIN